LPAAIAGRVLIIAIAAEVAVAKCLTGVDARYDFVHAGLAAGMGENEAVEHLTWIACLPIVGELLVVVAARHTESDLAETCVARAERRIVLNGLQVIADTNGPLVEGHALVGSWCRWRSRTHERIAKPAIGVVHNRNAGRPRTFLHGVAFGRAW